MRTWRTVLGTKQPVPMPFWNLEDEQTSTSQTTSASGKCQWESRVRGTLGGAGDTWAKSRGHRDWEEERFMQQEQVVPSSNWASTGGGLGAGCEGGRIVKELLWPHFEARNRQTGRLATGSHKRCSNGFSSLLPKGLWGREEMGQ